MALVCWIFFMNIFGFSFFKESPKSFFLHDFHTSISEAEYNESNKTFEVSLRVFTNDFEEALAQKNKIKNLKLDKNSKYNDLIEAYIKDNFYFTDSKNKKLPLNFVGKELDVDVTWIYFEIPFNKYNSGYSITNSVLVELFDDQVNLVNLKYKGLKKTYLLKTNKTTTSLTLQ